MNEKFSPRSIGLVRTLEAVCLLIWFAIMSATLWPFNPRPHNDVRWLGKTNGIHLGPKGVVLGTAPFLVKTSQGPISSSLEVLLRIDNENKVNTILNFYTSENPGGFRLRQYNDSLIIVHDLRDQQNRTKTTKFDVDHIFHVTKPTLLTITSSKKGTAVYADGLLVQTSGDFKVSEKDFSGNLVAGTSPLDFDPWSGDLLGLAIYGRELNNAEIRKHFEDWEREGKVTLLESETPIAIYAFDEGTGALIHNQVASEPDLRIPNYFLIPAKPMLRLPWDEFSADWYYVEDFLRNIAGFIPLGMIFYFYFSWGRQSPHAALVTIALGATTSLIIEIVQAFIPQRYSGTTDIITNTLGTALGVLFLRAAPVRAALAKMGVFDGRV